MRASQKLQDRCQWIRVLNKLDVDIAEERAKPDSLADGLEPVLFSSESSRFFSVSRFADLVMERIAAVDELAALGYVVSNARH